VKKVWQHTEITCLLRSPWLTRLASCCVSFMMFYDLCCMLFLEKMEIGYGSGARLGLASWGKCIKLI
jgi:hypothetical protein